jgi:hypothetical protein
MPEYFLVTEPPPLFTLGKRGGLACLTVGEEFTKNKGLGIVQNGRGGNMQKSRLDLTIAILKV